MVGAVSFFFFFFFILMYEMLSSLVKLIESFKKINKRKRWKYVNKNTHKRLNIFYRENLNSRKTQIDRTQKERD